MCFEPPSLNIQTEIILIYVDFYNKIFKHFLFFNVKNRWYLSVPLSSSLLLCSFALVSIAIAPFFAVLGDVGGVICRSCNLSIPFHGCLLDLGTCRTKPGQFCIKESLAKGKSCYVEVQRQSLYHLLTPAVCPMLYWGLARTTLLQSCNNMTWMDPIINPPTQIPSLSFLIFWVLELEAKTIQMASAHQTELCP